IIKLETDFPLLSLRARKLKSHLFNSAEKRKKYILEHKNNLKWHLGRMYRLRNELIHDAGLFENIENITSNLKYYLTFIINKLIEYYADVQPKPNSDKKIMMDDFF